MKELLDYYRRQGAPGDQTALVGLLREIQGEYGAVPKWAVTEIAESYKVKESFILAVVKRIPSLRLQDTHLLQLCAGPNCGKHTALAAEAEKLCKLKPGDPVTELDLQPVAELLTQALEMAAGLREPTELLEQLWTEEVGEKRAAVGGKDPVLSFSGGVADCIQRDLPWSEFGDMGPILGRTIRASRLCQGEYRLGDQTIRATVIGAGCHSAQLSGSTVFYRNVTFPMKNLPVAKVEDGFDSGKISETLTQQEADRVVLALPGIQAPAYDQVKAMASAIAEGFGSQPVIVALEQDMAKALGHALALVLPPDREILCIDNVRMDAQSYLDVGAPVGYALPIVVKTLILSR